MTAHNVGSTNARNRIHPVNLLRISLKFIGQVTNFANVFASESKAVPEKDEAGNVRKKEREKERDRE